MKMFCSDKTSWESWGKSLGVISEEHEVYTRKQKEKDLQKANQLEEVFSKFNWGSSGQQQ